MNGRIIMSELVDLKCRIEKSRLEPRPFCSAGRKRLLLSGLLLMRWMTKGTPGFRVVQNSLPKDVRLVGVSLSFRFGREDVELTLESKEWPEVPKDQVPPEHEPLMLQALDQ